ncbi:ABC transporter ATP-binding protein [Desulfovirgula thermocuniculi]|uniref:ABC transporter ATP-binding protein n=1 Tax=Desulfovirgula thermocuniculi TaxID=348842 RepID=UPI0004064773|nr:ABC transporter ATP-binding protein [Desulfovirgula thermocuniculi]
MLRVEGLTKKFGGLLAVNKVSFTAHKGEVLALIGPNGAGKTTVFNLISGALRPTAGQVYLEGKPIGGKKPYQVAKMGIARTFQTTTVFDQLKVLDNLLVAHKLRTSSGLVDTILRTRRWKKELEESRARAMEVLDFIGLKEKALAPVQVLTQEERKRLAIGVALATGPKVLLLDEPTAGLLQEETEGIFGLIKSLKQRGMTVCVIEHKMRMVMNLADRVVVLNYGHKIAEGTPEEVSRNELVIQAYLGGEHVA